MPVSVEDLEDLTRFRMIKTISYDDLTGFIMEQLKKKTIITGSFWLINIIFLACAVIMVITISGYYSAKLLFLHSVLGLLLFPLISIPEHELLHAIPFIISGARRIRVGMDLKQYIFYVTAHRYVASSLQYIIVAVTPFIVNSIILILLLCCSGGIWKWSLSLFLFVHTTMCAGDIGMINFYYLNRGKNIFSWDDVDRKEAYFYEEV
jgi:hypothetical protein